ncbi:Uncharacterised protein [Mycobacteroides abscessus subsp. abscessus]|nr:Uncharacterised protein [Mycobacteroides abscessus subsp. abscessus]
MMSSVSSARPRPSRRCTSSSTGTRNSSTASIVTPRASSMAANASAWSTVRGKPSRMNPAAASGSSRRASTILLVTSLGTRSPASRYCLACRPSSVPSLMFERNRSPVEICGIPNFSEISCACVPLPAPGGPSNTTLTSGTLRSYAASTGFQSASRYRGPRRS